MSADFMDLFCLAPVIPVIPSELHGLHCGTGSDWQSLPVLWYSPHSDASKLNWHRYEHTQFYRCITSVKCERRCQPHTGTPSGQRPI